MSSTIRSRLILAAAITCEMITVKDAEGAFPVEVRGLSQKELGVIQTSAIIENDEGDRVTDISKLQPQLVIAGAYDPVTKEKLFSAADLELVEGLSAGVLEPIVSAVARLSGMGDKAVTAAEKNS